MLANRPDGFGYQSSGGVLGLAGNTHSSAPSLPRRAALLIDEDRRPRHVEPGDLGVHEVNAHIRDHRRDDPVAGRPGRGQTVHIPGGRETRIRDAGCEAAGSGSDVRATGVHVARVDVTGGGVTRVRAGARAGVCGDGPRNGRRGRDNDRGDEQDGLAHGPSLGANAGLRCVRRHAPRGARGSVRRGDGVTSGWRSRRCGPNGIRTACGAVPAAGDQDLAAPPRRTGRGAGPCGPRPVLRLGHHARWAAARGQDGAYPRARAASRAAAPAAAARHPSVPWRCEAPAACGCSGALMPLVVIRGPGGRCRTGPWP